MKFKKIFASHEVIQKGLQLYYIRADRTKRDLLKQGKIRKLTDREKEQRGYDTKQAIYEWIGDERSNTNL